MARRWSKHLDHTNLIEDIYWHRILPREQAQHPWGPEGPAPELVLRAYQQARAIADRYRRLKRCAARQAAQL